MVAAAGAALLRHARLVQHRRRGTPHGLGFNAVRRTVRELARAVRRAASAAVSAATGKSYGEPQFARSQGREGGDALAHVCRREAPVYPCVACIKSTEWSEPEHMAAICLMCEGKGAYNEPLGGDSTRQPTIVRASPPSAAQPSRLLKSCSGSSSRRMHWRAACAPRSMSSSSRRGRAAPARSTCGGTQPSVSLVVRAKSPVDPACVTRQEGVRTRPCAFSRTCALRREARSSGSPRRRHASTRRSSRSSTSRAAACACAEPARPEPRPAAPPLAPFITGPAHTAVPHCERRVRAGVSTRTVHAPFTSIACSVAQRPPPSARHDSQPVGCGGLNLGSKRSFTTKQAQGVPCGEEGGVLCVPVAHHGKERPPDPRSQDVASPGPDCGVEASGSIARKLLCADSAITQWPPSLGVQYMRRR